MPSGRLHPSHHLLYAFVVGAVITALGFLLALLDGAGPGGGGARQGTITVAGSETLRPYFSGCAASFATAQDARGIGPAKRSAVRVRGGGTASGLDALLDGHASIAMASREPTDAEARRAGERGQTLHAVPLAMEAIAVVVHPSVNLDALDLERAGRLLDGSLRDWSALGLPAAAVTVIARDAASGTAAVVAERLTQGRPPSAEARRVATHEAVLDSVAATPGAIGYADAGLAAQRRGAVRVLALRAEPEEPALLPDDEHLARGDYPLARELLAITLGAPAGEIAELIEHCRGPGADRLREAAGWRAPPATDLARR